MIYSVEAKYEAKLEFLGGRGAAKQKTFCGESMDIFWNYTLSDLVAEFFNNKICNGLEIFSSCSLLHRL